MSHEMPRAERQLEQILNGGYGICEQVTFALLQEWEDELSDPHFLSLLYDQIVMDQLIDGAPKKEVEPGLMGYIKGQKLRAHKRSRELATTDSLTGLLNKDGFEDELSRAFKRADRNYRETDKKLVLAAVDLNNFKTEANDKHGHHFGDDLLRYTAEAFNRYTRANDYKARLGGDEFVLLFDPFSEKKITHGDYFAQLTLHINNYIQERIRAHHPGKEADVTVSLGISVFDSDATTKEELLEHADKAMYFAKTNPTQLPEFSDQRNPPLVRFHVYDPSMSHQYIQGSSKEQARVDTSRMTRDSHPGLVPQSTTGDNGR